MTRALILAAGQGMRLRPLTDDRPKCLVPLLGISLLERQAHTLRAAGVAPIHVTTGYRAELIDDLGFETTYNPRFATTNMVESMFAALDYIKSSNSDLLISYGDIVYNRENLEGLLACDDEIALMIDRDWLKLWSLRQENPLDDAETLVLSEDDYVIELGKKPDGFDRIQGQYTGLIKFSGRKIKELVDFYSRLDRSCTYDGMPFDNMYMTSFLQSLIDHGWQAKAVFVKNGWLEIDSIDDLRCYENLNANGQLEQYYKADLT